jgi:hypothetical protein
MGKERHMIGPNAFDVIICDRQGIAAQQITLELLMYHGDVMKKNLKTSLDYYFATNHVIR